MLVFFPAVREFFRGQPERPGKLMNEIERVPMGFRQEIDSVFPLLAERQIRFFLDDEIFRDRFDQGRLLEDVQEDGDKHGVREIDKKGPDHWDNQKRPWRPAVAVDEGLHAGHGIGRRSEHKAAETAPHNG